MIVRDADSRMRTPFIRRDATLTNQKTEPEDRSGPGRFTMLYTTSRNAAKLYCYRSDWWCCANPAGVSGVWVCIGVSGAPAMSDRHGPPRVSSDPANT